LNRAENAAKGQRSGIAGGQWWVVNDVLYRRANTEKDEWKVTIPVMLRSKIVAMVHDLIGHAGAIPTTFALAKQYYFPQMRKEVRRIVSTCEPCAKIKSGNKVGKRRAPHLLPRPTPEGRLRVIAMDIVTGLPESINGNNAMLVVVDLFSKRTLAWPTMSTLTAPQMAMLFYDRYLSDHGLPYQIISDRDTRVLSVFWKEIAAKLGVEISPTQSAYHQQADPAERAIREVLRTIRTVLAAKGTDWESALPAAIYGVNSAPSHVDGLSPFERDLGYCPTLGMADLPESTRSMRNASARALADHLEQIAQLVLDTRRDAALRQAEAVNKNRTEETYKLGQKVWLSTRFLRAHSSKLDVKWVGPFPIVEVLRYHAYRLELPEKYKRVHSVFDAGQLKAWQETDVDSPNKKLLWEADIDPAVCDKGKSAIDSVPKEPDSDEFEVEAVVGHKVVEKKGKQTLQLKIRWRGYTPKADTYEPFSNLARSQRTVTGYLDSLSDHVATCLTDMVPARFKPGKWAILKIASN